MKWKQIDDSFGTGFIKTKNGREYSFNSKDCLNNSENFPRGQAFFGKGDRVYFDELATRHNGKHKNTPKATNVEPYFELIDNHIESDKDKEEPLKIEKEDETADFNCDKKVVRKEIKRGKSKEQKLLTLFREYNQMKKDEIFSTTLNSCDICYTDKVGSQCVKFVGCDHVYCKECMSGYLNVRIKEGAVSNLVCPTDKCTSQILPTQVSELVAPELYQKYETILLDTQLDSMTDVVLCPRVACQCPTMIDRDSNMGQCPSCHLAFCIYCRQTYHGVTPCKMKSKEQRLIIDQYSNSSGEARIFLEKKYGKRQLETMAANLASDDYIKDKAKPCPHCNAPIEKNDGCNKITCWRCSTNFCWLCGNRLDKQNPYNHFHAVGGACYGLLFQGIDPGEGCAFSHVEKTNL